MTEDGSGDGPKLSVRPYGGDRNPERHKLALIRYVERTRATWARTAGFRAGGAIL
jgi:hypothetical protein